ncbi:MAG TPA: hypothetical protein VGD78_02715 [Chthoniobacterales bacterium]
MARKVDSAQTFLVRAGANGDWELWACPQGRPTQFLQRVTEPNQVPGRAVVALPAQQVLTFPSWLATDDQKAIPEMLRLRLEERGLVQRNVSGVPMDYRVLDTQANRSLALVTVLQPDFPGRLAFERAVRFEPSAFTLPLPSDSLTVWKEAGRLTLAVTRGPEAVYLQTLSSSDLNPEAVQEIACILLQLEGQKLTNAVAGVVLWGEFTESESKALGARLGLRVVEEPFPAPTLPKTASRLLPAEVEALHVRKRRRDRVRALIIAVLALYAAGVLCFYAYLSFERWQTARLQQQLNGEAETVRAIQSTSDRWRNVEWAVDPHVYPVELLNQIASLLPAEGMRLTSFEIQRGKVVVRGEASTAPAAFKFAEDVKAKPELQMFQWQMPSPSLRADGRAEFMIEGEPKFAKIN